MLTKSGVYLDHGQRFHIEEVTPERVERACSRPLAEAIGTRLPHIKDAIQFGDDRFWLGSIGSGVGGDALAYRVSLRSLWAYHRSFAEFELGFAPLPPMSSDGGDGEYLEKQKAEYKEECAARRAVDHELAAATVCFALSNIEDAFGQHPAKAKIVAGTDGLDEALVAGWGFNQEMCDARTGARFLSADSCIVVMDTLNQMFPDLAV